MSVANKPFFKKMQEFYENRGFALLATLCVIIITATAIWTNRLHTPYQAPPQPTTDGFFAASLMQERLQDATTPTPLPTSQPTLWQAPLPRLEMIAPFSSKHVHSEWSGVWELHEAVDLAAEAGTPVKAMGSGSITAMGKDGLDGIWVEISHIDGYHSRYAGLSLTAAIREGDIVKAGQTIGFVGTSSIQEEHLGTHLHLQVFKDGQAIDPMTLLD